MNVNMINLENSLFGVKTDSVSSAEMKRVTAQQNLVVKAETMEQMEALINIVRLAPQKAVSNNQQIQFIKNQIQNNEYLLDMHALVEHLSQELSV
jgi:hypothetical protein